MRVELAEKGTPTFYREAVNVAAQYRLILRKHHRPVRDQFRQMGRLLVAGVVVGGLLAATMLAWGARTLDYVVLAVLGIACALCAAYLYSLRQLLRAMMADERTSVLVLDDEGIELRKGATQTVRLGWDNVAVVRVLSEGAHFLAGDQTGLTLSVELRQAPELLSWLAEHQPSVEVA